jgi:hypothetical protein
MPYEKKELVPGRFLWRCSDCGKEHPLTPVKKHELGPAPHHDCSHEGRLDMKAILEEQAAKENPTLHLGDIVEEIATNRRGKIDNMSITHGPQGQQTVNSWRVYFNDGKQPLLGMFKNREELRLVSCPHTEGEPRFTPARSIMG